MRQHGALHPGPSLLHLRRAGQLVAFIKGGIVPWPMCLLSASTQSCLLCWAHGNSQSAPLCCPALLICPNVSVARTSHRAESMGAIDVGPGVQPAGAGWHPDIVSGDYHLIRN